ncbi:alkaline phosphatase-like [Macrobrachium rosenbergii]|uniref:alkaline phosphatase-like n=1 Tax=Macrobrachium rosenbergii TaxID=79674 RepID=UPI0034D7225B
MDWIPVVGVHLTPPFLSPSPPPLAPDGQSSPGIEPDLIPSMATPTAGPVILKGTSEKSSGIIFVPRGENAQSSTPATLAKLRGLQGNMKTVDRITSAGIASLLLLPLLVTAMSQRPLEDRAHWWALAQNELAAALNVRDNWNVAKNVIMFLGDGMGITVNTAGRIFKGQKQNMNGEEGYLAWERFPNAGLLKTYNVDKQVPDSAATATAYLCGVKTRYYTLGVDSSVNVGDCAASKNPATHTPSILQWAQEAGKDTGFVTTTRVTHATPAALYAHTPQRRWECDGTLGDAGVGCKDIADQLVTENPGRNIKVIMGGGRHPMGAAFGASNAGSCLRRDGRDLTKEWLLDKTQRGFRARYVTNLAELATVDTDDTDFLMGLFDDSHVPFEVDRQGGPQGTPSLAEMSLTALKIFFTNLPNFQVEGGRIDHALHNNMAHRAFEEVVAMDRAVNAILNEIDLEETLVIVTADHSHVMTINGYPDRGNDILGITGDFSEVDNKPYTTIMFTNGPGFNFTTDGQNVSTETLNVKMNFFFFCLRIFYSTWTKALILKHCVFRKISKNLYSPLPLLTSPPPTGPMSHLFHRTHEQHYVAHVMAYAACVGPSRGARCERPAHATITRGVSPPQPPREAAAAAAAVSVGPAIATAVASVSSSASAEAIAAPKFPTLSPILQQLIETNEEKILVSIGTARTKSKFPGGVAGTATVVGGSNLQDLLGKHAIDIPHSL